MKTEPGLALVKTEPGAPVKTELDDDEAALEWARRDSIAMEKERLEKTKERQCAALRRFALATPLRGPPGTAASRRRKSDDGGDDGGDDGDYSAFSQFLF